MITHDAATGSNSGPILGMRMLLAQDDLNINDMGSIRHQDSTIFNGEIRRGFGGDSDGDPSHSTTTFFWNRWITAELLHFCE